MDKTGTAVPSTAVPTATFMNLLASLGIGGARHQAASMPALKIAKSLAERAVSAGIGSLR
jgi:hypothetical protein